MTGFVELNGEVIYGVDEFPEGAVDCKRQVPVVFKADGPDNFRLYELYLPAREGENTVYVVSNNDGGTRKTTRDQLLKLRPGGFLLDGKVVR